LAPDMSICSPNASFILVLQLSATRTTDIQHPQTRTISLKLVERRALLRHTNTKPTSWWLSEAANVISWFVTSSRQKTKTGWKRKSVAWIYLWHSLKDAKANFTYSLLWEKIEWFKLTLPRNKSNTFLQWGGDPSASLEGFPPVWRARTVPASAEFTILDPFMCRGMVGMLWRQKYTL